MNYGLALNLRDDAAAIAAYLEAHRNVWPEVRDDLREIGVRDMQIYLLGRRLFMWLDVPDDFDPSTEFARLLDRQRSREWDDLMRTMQEPVPEAAEGEWWAQMMPVFRLSAQDGE